MGNKVSIITVCYNSAKTIEQTILSIIYQTSQNYEYLIIDGGSTDGTLDIIEKYKSAISYFVSEPDQGIYDAMNKGIQISKGNVIAFLNSDDWYSEDTISRVLDEFENNDVDIVYGDVLIATGTGVPIRRNAFINETFHHQMTIFHPATFVRLDMFDRIGLFDLQFKVAADYDWLLRAFIGGAKFHHTENVLTNFRYGGVSVKELDLCTEETRSICLKWLPENLKTKFLPLINDEYEKHINEAAVLRKTKHLLSENKSLLIDLISDYIKPDETVYVWGSGIMGMQCLEWLQAIGVSVKAIIDTDEQKWQYHLDGIEIAGINILLSEPHKVIITPDKFGLAIARELEDLGLKDYVFWGDVKRGIIK